MHFRNSNKILSTVFAASVLLNTGSAAADTLSVSQEMVADLQQRVIALETKSQANASSAFNPSITVFGNVLGCFSPSSTSTDSQKYDGCPNSVFLREFELDLRADIAPHVSGVVILSLGQEEPGHFHAGIEEAYALFKPGFGQIKVGRFLSSFGRVNRIHTHDLPQMTKPQSAVNFFGDHGLAQDGASAEFILPTPGESNALTLNTEIMFGTSFEHPMPLAGKNALPKFMGRLSWFFDLGNGHDLDIGGSSLLQPRSEGGALFQLYGADFNYRWRPYILGANRSFLVGAEMFAAAHSEETYFGSLPIGGFAWTQFQINQAAYLGLRYSYDQGTNEASQINTSAGVFLTYYTTEFLRFRVGYERVANDVSFKDGRDNFLMELNFIFGSHPAEPYWVNR